MVHVLFQILALVTTRGQVQIAIHIIVLRPVKTVAHAQDLLPAPVQDLILVQHVVHGVSMAKIK